MPSMSAAPSACGNRASLAPRVPGLDPRRGARRAFSTGGSYVNFQTADEGEARVRACYGANYDRLAGVKRPAARQPVRSNRNVRPEAPAAKPCEGCAKAARSDQRRLGALPSGCAASAPAALPAGGAGFGISDADHIPGRSLDQSFQLLRPLPLHRALGRARRSWNAGAGRERIALGQALGATEIAISFGPPAAEVSPAVWLDRVSRFVAAFSPSVSWWSPADEPRPLGLRLDELLPRRRRGRAVLGTPLGAAIHLVPDRQAALARLPRRLHG